MAGTQAKTKCENARKKLQMSRRSKSTVKSINKLVRDDIAKSRSETKNETQVRRKRKLSAARSNAERQPGNKRKRKGKVPSVSSTSVNEDSNCIFCDDLFSQSKSKEQWIYCKSCLKWSHVECAGVDKNESIFICDFCAD